MITFKNVHKSFGELQVLCGVDLYVPAGSVTVLCGASGSGKTTLLRCANGLERVDAGDVTVDDTHINGRGDLRRLRSQVGMVFQQFSLYPHMSILQNVSLAPAHVLGLRAADARARALDCLERIGMADRADDFPARLSGGEQQRVAIARALAMEPRVLLLDEPTASLDPDNKGEVLDTIAELVADGRTMLIATHELLFARQVGTEIALLAEGRIVEQSPPAEFLGACKTEHARRFLKRFHAMLP